MLVEDYFLFRFGVKDYDKALMCLFVKKRFFIFSMIRSYTMYYKVFIRVKYLQVR